MRICGIDYNGSDIVPVVVEETDDGWRFVPLQPPKITLSDIWDTTDVRLFAKTVTAFLAEHAIDLVVVKKRATGGKYGGGAASFRMGGILQTSTENPVVFISAQAVSAALRGASHDHPKGLYKYQRSAYDVVMAYVQTEAAPG